MCANEFDHTLWGPLFKRINFECRNSGERLQKRPALNLGLQYTYLTELKNKKVIISAEDVEVVYPDKVFDGNGNIKAKSVHIFVPEIFTDIPGVFKEDGELEDGGLKQFLKMMAPPYTNKDPDVR